MQAIAPSLKKEKITAEIHQLPEAFKLMSRSQYDVFLVPAAAIPTVLQEIGRLREITFRAVGEGTGKERDIDAFDEFFHNLFIWDREAQQIVGGYRLGFGQELADAYGVAGHYISTLFDIEPEAYPLLRQSLELGRSYVIPAYQKGYLPFFLLWRGILLTLIRHPQYRYLIGPVSISKFYSDVCKSMIVQFVKRYYYDQELAQSFHPRTPFLPKVQEMELDKITGQRLQDLETFLANIEPEHMKLPIMLKQYTKLNARFISFNLDPNFSDALDGLMILNLADLPPNIIQLLEEK
ncbi:MAG: GNAT family N-acetyltransferase [Bacteroidota bacterium]